MYTDYCRIHYACMVTYFHQILYLVLTCMNSLSSGF